MFNINLPLAAAITSMQSLEVGVGFVVGIVVIFSYIYAVCLIIGALIQERGDGSWKMALARGLGIFAASGMCTIMLLYFFNITIAPSFQ